jgi:serine/threonine protein kinase/Tol biopolymer transport system component
MALNSGTRLGPYEVAALIGVGGMGEVYRARDTNLGRDVAIKVLPETVALDPERLGRLEREAHVLASLNHPNIATIHDLKDLEGSKYLILELVEGETLAERIALGPLELDEALDIAHQIAEAVEAAHERGVVHRDIKPANVKITPDGRVKVLDFGLAKIYESPTTSPTFSHSPTLSAMHTSGGVILGTAAYMSPEQARGRTVDRRSDVWAFGCVLYEMLSGRQAFPNQETVSDTLAAILKEEPAWNALPARTPHKIQTLLERCLRKDVRRRLPDIGEARIEIEEARSEPQLGAGPPPRDVSRRRSYLRPAVAILTLLAAAAAGWTFLAPIASTDIVRFDIVAPRGASPLPPDGRTIEVGQPLSPDGRKVAFLASTTGRQMLWVRSLESSTVQPLPGTEDATRPAWSPDSQYIAFFAQGRLKKVAVAGGPPSVICDEPGRDITWSTENVILIGGRQKGLLRVSGAGGEPMPATELDAKETTHDYPEFLPDGRHFVYMARRGGQPEDWDVFVGSLDSEERRLLPGIHAGVRYSPSGHLLFIRDRTLMAHPFDLNRLELTGEAFPVAERVMTGPRPPFSISTNGTLSYLGAAPGLDTQLAWFDRTGQQRAIAGPTGEYSRLHLSPDGKQVVFDRLAGLGPDIFILDTEKGSTSLFVSGGAADFAPVWSPDGRTIAFASSRDPAINMAPTNIRAGNLYQRSVGVVGEDKVLFKSSVGKTPTDWSRDGRYLTYSALDDVWALPLPVSDHTQPSQVTKTPFVESGARFSPDGRWIAYQTNESGAQDVYIQSFPESGLKQKVSLNGGSLPRWSRDSKELFYIATDLRLMSVSMTPTGAAGTPVPLFQSRVLQGNPNYEVAADGRFLLNIPSTEQTAMPLTVIVNWAAQFRK